METINLKDFYYRDWIKVGTCKAKLPESIAKTEGEIARGVILFSNDYLMEFETVIPLKVAGAKETGVYLAIDKDNVVSYNFKNVPDEAKAKRYALIVHTGMGGYYTEYFKTKAKAEKRFTYVIENKMTADMMEQEKRYPGYVTRDDYQFDHYTSVVVKDMWTYECIFKK